MNIHKTVLHRYYPVFCLLIIILATCIIYISSFEGVFSDEPLHKAEFVKLDVYKDFPGVDIDIIHQDVMLYYQDKSTKGPPFMPFFDEKENQHLWDVKQVIAKTLNFKKIAIIIILALSFIVFVLYPTYSIRRLGMLTFGTGIATLISIGIFLFLVNFRFNWFFATFHKLFFKPGTWTFATKITTLYPFQFFFDLTQEIITKILLYGILFIVVGLLLFGSSKKWE